MLDVSLPPAPWVVPRAVEVWHPPDAPFPADAVATAVGADVVFAVKIAVARGTFSVTGGELDDDLDAGWDDGPGRDRTLQQHVIAPRPAPSWTVARAWGEASRPAPDRDLRVDRAPCVTLGVVGAEVGYWVVETDRCVDHLLVPDEDGAAAAQVPARCLGASDELAVVARYFDGSSSRHRVRAGVPADPAVAPRLGAAAALLAGALWLARRRRPLAALRPS